MESNWRVSLKGSAHVRLSYKKRKNKIVFWAGVMPAIFFPIQLLKIKNKISYEKILFQFTIQRRCR